MPRMGKLTREEINWLKAAIDKAVRKAQLIDGIRLRPVHGNTSEARRRTQAKYDLKRRHGIVDASNELEKERKKRYYYRNKERINKARRTKDNNEQ